MMKNIILLFSVLLFSSLAYAGTTSGKIGVSLTLMPMCSVDVSDTVPQVKCGNATDAQPKVTRSRLQNESGSETYRELVTVEW
ncbi:hypothetical protein [Serratia liquefaciens]|uniref:DUF2574 family protein n=1 Tax=Serratia liquefaciens TaxID=614 RepID=A0A515D088_SERLI|nr:hypothetical protein [Serratia liquefaciens]QDL33816.1 hypothetical protein EGO53_19345 [Serratia liquefaciens]